jgi:hypothetical protein
MSDMSKTIGKGLYSSFEGLDKISETFGNAFKGITSIKINPEVNGRPAA